MTTRRSFLGLILALGAAPAIVRADALMRVVPRETTLFNAADWINWDPAADHSLTRIALCTSDGVVRVLDLAWGAPQRLAVASLPIDADSPRAEVFGAADRATIPGCTGGAPQPQSRAWHPRPKSTTSASSQPGGLA